MRSPLETDALADDALSRKSSRRLWCKSVMAVQEKCDEKESRQPSAISHQILQPGVGYSARRFSKSARSGAPGLSGPRAISLAMRFLRREAMVDKRVV